MSSGDGSFRQFPVHLGLLVPAGLFKDRCTDFRGFQSFIDILIASMTIIAAPFAALFLAGGSLICSVYQASKGQFKLSACSLLVAIGYTVLAPLSPVIALGSFIARGIHSIYDLARSFVDVDEKKIPVKTELEESVEAKPVMTPNLIKPNIEETPIAPSRSIEPTKSNSTIYKEQRRGLTIFPQLPPNDHKPPPIVNCP